MKKILIPVICLALAAAGCTSATIKPFQDGSSVTAATEGEKRLWASADRLDKALTKSDQVYDNDGLTKYMQAIMDRLYPEFKGTLTVQLLKDPVLNAFALPNGSIYVNIGLIAALDNEAQLASVLAHEGIHFTMKHGALQREHFHNAMGAGMAVSLLGVPFIGQLAAASSIFGYSKEHELEADKLGYERLTAAGYDTEEAPKAFNHLLVEAKANGDDAPFFFSTHPALEKRIENFNNFNKSRTPGTGEKGEDAYRQHVTALRKIVLDEKVKAAQYNAVIEVLSNDEMMKSYTPECRFYLGEALRLRGEEGDTAKAWEAYEKVMAEVPGFAPVYRSMGMLAYKDKDYDKAKSFLEKYFSFHPDEKESAFAKYYLNRIINKGKTNETE